MHLVLQQEWINGKSYLVENGELNTLLDILNLSSDALEKEGEADRVSEVREQEEVLEWEEDTAEKDVLLAEEDEDGLEQLIEETEADEFSSEAEKLSDGDAQEEMQQEADDQVLVPELEYDVVVAWYYWPNGTLLKG